MTIFRGIFILFFALVFRVGMSGQTPAPLQADFGEAILRQWVQPQYPEAARQAKLSGAVTVEFVVETDGRVSRAAVKQSSDERFNASALAAVGKWIFVPATADGKSVASGLQTRLVFGPEQLNQKKIPTEAPFGSFPTTLSISPAKLINSPEPDYPEELSLRRLNGQVVLEFTVGEDGKPSAPKVLWASHAAFVNEALRALSKYQFEPSRQGPLTLKAPGTRGQMEFESVNDSIADVLSANKITLTEPEKFEQPPKPAVLHEPVYPRELLLAGEEGSASVSFSVTERGRVADVLLQDATRPEFGASLVAAVEAWHFEPALNLKQPTASKLTVVQKFAPPTKGPTVSVIQALKPDGTGIKGAGGLDEKLRPLWRVSPSYPKALEVEKPPGKTVIQFVIDREGRARLPTVVSASHPEFGWSAAAAISQWVFAPPTRGGQPVDVQVSIPVDFAAPKE